MEDNPEHCQRPDPNPEPDPDPTPKPRLKIRVRVKPEPTDGIHLNPQEPPRPQPEPVPDYLRCHRNDGRSWRCKKQVLEGQKLCEVHFNKAKLQNQKRPSKRQKRLSEEKCVRRLKVSCSGKVSQIENVGGCGGVISMRPPPQPPLEELPLVPQEVVEDGMRCVRNDGREWRCKRRIVDGESFCEVHIKRVKVKGGLSRGEGKLRGGGGGKVAIKGLSGGEGRKKGGGGGKVVIKGLSGEEGKKRGGGGVGKVVIKGLSRGEGKKGGGGKVVIKVVNDEERDNLMEGVVVALPAKGGGVVRGGKGNRKGVGTGGGAVSSKKVNKKVVVVGDGVGRVEKGVKKAVVEAKEVVKVAENVVVEEEEFRCKRADGRGWRCKRRVLEGKTMCEVHYEQGRLRQLKITVPEELKIQRGEEGEKVEKRLKRKKELDVLESNSDKGMKRMRAELIRVFLKREIIESSKKVEDEVEDSGEVRKDLPYGSMAIPPAPPSQILGNAESLRIKIGVPRSNSLVTRSFRSKNVEPPPICPVKIVPFPGKAEKVRSSSRKKCHWCRKSDNLSLSKCSSCRKRYFCSICIKERSSDPKEIKLRCPVCCGTCDCKACCVTTQKTDMSSKEAFKEKFKGTKFQQLEYVINLLLPILVQINEEQTAEMEMEAKFKGQNPSDVEIRQANVDCRDQYCCNNCKSPIVDFHRSCPNCSYNLCLSCCRAHTQRGILGATYPNRTKTLVRCQEKSSMSVDLASTSHQISCPPMELGGCDNSLLDLRCIFPSNWTKELEIIAKETISELDCRQIDDDSVHCLLCTSIIKAGDKSKELQAVSRRKGSDDNFLYCPSTLDDANSVITHFQKHWRKGHPVKVRNVLKCASALSWDPLAIFCGYLENGFSNCKNMKEATDAASCCGSYDVQIGTKESFVGSAQEGYMHMCREILKLKARISTAFSRKLLEGSYTEIIHGLPLQQYTNPRMGLLNIAAKLPDDFSDSNLGPHLCISCGSKEEVARGELVTKLCCNSYDEVSILVHVGDTKWSTEQLNKLKKLIKRNINMKDQGGQTSNKNLEDDETRLHRENSVEAGERLRVVGTSCCSAATNDAAAANNCRDDKSPPAKQFNGSDTDSDASMICSRASRSPEEAVYQLPCNNLSVNVNNQHSLELCGAQWDVFRRSDIPKLLEYISKHAHDTSLGDGLPNNVVHPIFDGCFYLDAAHKLQLKEEFEIEPWTFNQYLGEAVFIPAGCPYQIKNFKSCVNIAVGFISPENASVCVKLMNEIRVLPNDHKAKQMKLEVEKMTICTIDEAIKELYRLMIEEGNR